MRMPQQCARPSLSARPVIQSIRIAALISPAQFSRFLRSSLLCAVLSFSPVQSGPAKPAPVSAPVSQLVPGAGAARPLAYCGSVGPAHRTARGYPRPVARAALPPSSAGLFTGARPAWSCYPAWLFVRLCPVPGLSVLSPVPLVSPVSGPLHPAPGETSDTLRFGSCLRGLFVRYPACPFYSRCRWSLP